MGDLAGNDIGYNIRKDQPGLFGPGERYPGLADVLVEAGRLGQKTKKGWYDYSAGRDPVDDEEVAQPIRKHSAEKGIKRRAISEEEVSQRRGRRQA
jgi:3-hydroxyacyl-CoA dehydrogenase